MVATRSTGRGAVPRRSAAAPDGAVNSTTRRPPPASGESTGAVTEHHGAALSDAAPPTASSLVSMGHSGTAASAVQPSPGAALDAHRHSGTAASAVQPSPGAAHDAHHHSGAAKPPGSTSCAPQGDAPRKPEAWLVHMSPPRSPSMATVRATAPPATTTASTSGPRPARSTTSSRSARVDTQRRLALALEERAKARLELLDVQIAALRAQAEEEDEDDLRSNVTEEDHASQRVTTWVSEQRTRAVISTRGEQCAAGASQPAVAHEPPPAAAGTRGLAHEYRVMPAPPPAALESPPLAALAPPPPHVEPQSVSRPDFTYYGQPPPRHAVYVPPPPQLPPRNENMGNSTVACPPLPGAVAESSTAPRTDLAELAAAITMAVKQSTKNLPSKYSVDLPVFSGSHQEWLSFRAAYAESAHYFSVTENTARLRRALKGRAREATENLLLHYTDPVEIMRTLEARYGRPEAIATTELEKLRKISKPADTPRDIILFANKVSNAVAALRALGRVHYLYNPEITALTSEKMPASIRMHWYKFSAEQQTDEPDLLKLHKFLQQIAEQCAPYAQPEPAQGASHSSDYSGRERRNTNQRSFNTTSEQQEKSRTCVVCGEEHGLEVCDKFRQHDVNGRWDIAKRERLCFKCLRLRTKKHFCKWRKCEEEGCALHHHRLLHHRKRANADRPTAQTAATEHISTARAGAAYLKIAPVTVSGPAGEVHTWALLDDGSTVTLVDESIAQRVGARGPVVPLRINTVGDKRIDASTSRRVTLTLTGERREPHHLQLRTIKQLRLSPQRISSKEMDDCQHLGEIAHLLSTSCGAPKILIGQDNWDMLLTHEIRKGRRDQPVASLTPLGWVIHGASRRRTNAVHFVAHLAENEENIEEQLRRHFAIESIAVTPKTPTSDPQRRAEEILDRNTRKRPDGHYETALLWDNEQAQMPANEDAALRRLISVEKKLSKDPALAIKYKVEMNNLLKKGYAEPAPTTGTPGRTWYLPHFAVLNPAKPGKVRVVHDAAAKTMGKSLNDYLLTGPDLLQSLPGVLMRFRQHAVAVTADIQEMFMQVKIREEDRDALRYLWRESPDDEPVSYRMTSLIFGATSSPATAIYVKNLNSKNFSTKYPEASAAIVRSHYMDDYLGSYETEEQAATVATQVRKINQAANFQLTKWQSSSRAVLRALREDDEEKTQEAVTITGGPAYERVLGLIWMPDADALTFNMNLARLPPGLLQKERPTKREALKIMMSVYDPLGFASVVTVQGKKILQELWRRGTPWDEKIDADLSTQWTDWVSELRALRDVAIPRCYGAYTACATLELHTFVDASESAYAAALYWRAVEEDGTVATSLVVAKARVAPVKLTSIPRLELQAAVLGARIASTVMEEHDRKPDRRFFWTDSRTALSWLRAGARTFKPFVAHRIAAIEEISNLSEWRWVPTKLNVADDATRDVPRDFGSQHRWFTGPEFLRSPEETWPSDIIPPAEPTEEERCCVTRGRNEPALSEALPPATHFSKWERYTRSAARVLQFIDRCRCATRRTADCDVNYKRTAQRKEKDPEWKRAPKEKKKAVSKYNCNNKCKFVPIPAETLRRAENNILRLSQQSSFGDEIESVTRNKPIERSSRLQRLAVTVVDGLLRINGRAGRITGVSSDSLSPPILDGNKHEVRLLIHYVHRKLHHAGVATTVNECRQHYWVLRLRTATKTVINNCLPCRIRKDNPPQPATGNLPTARLAHHSRPFTYVGVDYFGPLSTVTGRTVNKRWVALFCCLTSRAVHLELATSLTTDSAVMALRRMIARRGTPTEIWSDNGTNLRGADKELRREMDTNTEEEATSRGICWRFIPPAAPFMGGAWERLVRSVKTALAATEQPRRPTDEVLTTLLAEAEYSVNSRPLTHLSTDPEDPEALTPNHFLLGGSARVPALGTYTDGDLMGRASWRASQRLADIFWARWLREYLPELQHRREPHSRGPIIEVGDVVIIADNTLPRNTWPRGRITATYPGADGITRVVDVQTKGGVLRRPVKKIILIPTNDVLHQGCSDPGSAARRENVPNE